MRSAVPARSCFARMAAAGPPTFPIRGRGDRDASGMAGDHSRRTRTRNTPDPLATRVSQGRLFSFICTGGFRC